MDEDRQTLALSDGVDPYRHCRDDDLCVMRMFWGMTPDDGSPGWFFWEKDLDRAHEAAIAHRQYLALLNATLDEDLARVRALVADHGEALKRAEAVEAASVGPTTIDETPLTAAVRLGLTEIVHLLLPVSRLDGFLGSDRGGESDHYHDTPLIAAVVADRPELVRLLAPLSNRGTACVQHSTSSRCEGDALSIAVGLDRLACVEALLESVDAAEGAPDPDSLEGKRRSAALLLAAWLGHWDVFKCLWRAADPKAVSEHGETPLILAAKHGHAEVVEFLLPLSDPRHIDARGWTALAAAVSVGSLDCIELLAPSSDLGFQVQDIYGRKSLLRLAAARAVGGAEHKAPFEQSARRLVELMVNERPQAADEAFADAMKQRAFNDAEFLGKLASDTAIVRELDRVQGRKAREVRRVMPLTLARYERAVMSRACAAASGNASDAPAAPRKAASSKRL